jgi:hypothetical protein
MTIYQRLSIFEPKSSIESEIPLDIKYFLAL